MVSKFIGIMLGIALANSIGSSMPLALASFTVVTWIHMFCNLKSYQCIHLRTLNPYRASKLSHVSHLLYFPYCGVSNPLHQFIRYSFHAPRLTCVFKKTIVTGLVFSEYLRSGQAPPIKDVNDEEPLFPAVPFLRIISAGHVSCSLSLKQGSCNFFSLLQVAFTFSYAFFLSRKLMI